jgi:selT/selW/selH-like putative selenoprotein
LQRGSSGAFNVIVDNRKLFSKHEEGRFPKESEIIEKLRAL